MDKMKMKEVAFGVLRHAATFGAGYLVSKGVIDAAQVEVIIGAVVALGGVVWSVMAKKKAD